MARDERGVAAVEFAIILPVLLLLLLGIIQFGLIFAVQSGMESAAEAGARRAAIVEQGGNSALNPQQEGRKAVERSLTPWWDLFFTRDDVVITPPCSGGGQAEWRVDIEVEMQTVAIVDPLDVLGTGRMSSSSVWPVGGGCGASGGGGGDENGTGGGDDNDGGDDNGGNGNPGQGNGPPNQPPGHS